jgi:hypothetical protein
MNPSGKRPKFRQHLSNFNVPYIYIHQTHKTTKRIKVRVKVRVMVKDRISAIRVEGYR